MLYIQLPYFVITSAYLTPNPSPFWRGAFLLWVTLQVSFFQKSAFLWSDFASLFLSERSFFYGATLQVPLQKGEGFRVR